jgi:hypothetical protein
MVLILGVLAVAGLAATYATFTDSGEGTGSVSAGTVDVKLTSGGPVVDDLTIIWDGLCPSGNLAPGDSCDVSGIGVRNTGSLTFDYDFEEFVDPPALADCYDIVSLGVVDADSGDTQHMPPGDVETFSMEVTLRTDAPNYCQGETASVGLTIAARQDDNDPHNPTDTH